MTFVWVATPTNVPFPRLSGGFVRGNQPAAAFWRARYAATFAREEQRSEQ